MKTLIVTPVGYELLGGLREPIQLLRPPSMPQFPPQSIVLIDAAHNVLHLSVSAEDVVFKFEVFGLRIEDYALDLKDQLLEFAVLGGWQSARCLFRFEWQRTAAPEEVRPGFEPVVTERGRRSSVGHLATDIGLSMVGIAFWSDTLGKYVGAIEADDEWPLRLKVRTNEEEIALLLGGCEIVEPAGVSEWITSARDWLGAL